MCELCGDKEAEYQQSYGKFCFDCSMKDEASGEPMGIKIK